MMNLLELLTRDTRLRRMASTHGGEYAGPCPFCGGRDRFRVWPNVPRPRYWCRGCGKNGDAIQYLRDHDGLSFREAQAQVGTTAHAGSEPRTRWSRREEWHDEPHFWPASRQEEPPETPSLSPDGSPSSTWQEAARKLCSVAQLALWTPFDRTALDYLHGRRLRDETIRQAQLGYWPRETYHFTQSWGFAQTEKQVWEPTGIIIPWLRKQTYWRVRIRSFTTNATYRYVQIRGSQNALYRSDTIRINAPVVMVEGEFDALTLAQEIDSSIAVVATGSTEGARSMTSLAQLATASRVLLAFDADAAGDRAAQWWLTRLDNAIRWRPFWSDPNALLQGGADLRYWVEAGLS